MDGVVEGVDAPQLEERGGEGEGSRGGGGGGLWR